MSDVVRVKGLDQLQAFLDQLPAKMEKNIMRSALRAGAKVILDDAKTRVPVSSGEKEGGKYGAYSGALRDSLRVTTRYRKGRVTASVKAGGVTKRGADVYYATWVEYGTKPHVIRARDRGFLGFAGGVYKQVMHPGARPHPYLRPALDTRAQQALEAVGHAIRRRLTKAGIEGAEEITIGGDE